MPTGPQPRDHADRVELIERLAQRCRDRYGDQVAALGYYGSVARGTDGPYSDVELLCILTGDHARQNFEWVAGPWKAEVNVYSVADFRAYARRVDDRWPLTHSMFQQVVALEDPQGIFAQALVLAQSSDPAAFRQVIEGMIVEELYELISKLRNARRSRQPVSIAALTMEFVQATAMMIALAHRHCYTTSGAVLHEARLLPDLPADFTLICGLARRGQLKDGALLIYACEKLWAGIVAWADQRGYQWITPEEIPF